MYADWIKSPNGRRVVLHWADQRPAWLWSGDGQSLIWRNTAARFFNAKLKKNGDLILGDATPIKGQVGRLLRLGSPGRSSLSRIQFLASGKPVSATCAVTPLELPQGELALLVTGVDPISREMIDLAGSFDSLAEEIMPSNSLRIVLDQQGRLLGGSDTAVAAFSPESGEFNPDTLPMIGAPTGWLGDREYVVTRFKASPDGATLILFEPQIEPELEPAPAEPETAPDATAAESIESTDSAEPVAAAEIVDTETWDEPDESAEQVQDLEAVDSIEEPELAPSTEDASRLTSLFDQLANDADLFTPIAEDEEFDLPPASAIEVDGERLVIEPIVEDELTGAADPSRRMLIRLVGRGFEPLAPTAPSEEPTDEPVEYLADMAVPAQPEAPVEEPAPVIQPDAENVERVSRYNFDELSRILNDRVGGENNQRAAASSAVAPTEAPGSLVNLSGETLVLNRLPLGILVFRDQQVLFANRAITEMIGYESVESLRSAGLAAIFPDVGSGSQEAGPVNHLVQRDGTLVPVTARLQSMSWQGKPALMLSASMTEVRTGHEAAVRAFAEMLADARQDGFVEANRAGVISLMTAQGRLMLGHTEAQVLGKPLSAVLDPSETVALKTFLERPARFAETARPALMAKGNERGTEVMLFAQGQAGIITGYFGFIRRRDTGAMPRLAPTDRDIDPALLERLSRGVRRPLNTIIGFADLIRSAAFGVIDNPRYLEYAQDIKTAGQEIAALVDELDDYSRLQDGRYAALPADVDLGLLLDTCVQRVRNQANAARVLVRSAISERLPRIRADRASLAQAVLNLLASAIDQTPTGGSVVLSAQLEDDGQVSVHVRDTASNGADMAERFVVFRDGIGRDGEVLMPVRSSVGLALTRSLLAVNACSLTVDPAGSVGTLFTLVIPRDLVQQAQLTTD